MTIYVDLREGKGLDSNPGTFDKPLATPQQAYMMVKSVQKDFTVIMPGGYLSDTVKAGG